MSGSCVEPGRECPWGPEEWQRLGRMEQQLKTLVRLQGEVTRKLDQLNHIRRRGAAAGGTAGVIVAGIVMGAGELIRRWMKTGQ